MNNLNINQTLDERIVRLNNLYMDFNGKILFLIYTPPPPPPEQSSYVEHAHARVLASIPVRDPQGKWGGSTRSLCTWNRIKIRKGPKQMFAEETCQTMSNTGGQDERRKKEKALFINVAAALVFLSLFSIRAKRYLLSVRLRRSDILSGPL